MMELAQPEIPWFVVHLRNGKDVVAQGEVERDRLMARKTPKAIGWKPAMVHECSVCGTRGAWTDQWEWYGSYADLEEGREIRKFCGQECRLKWSKKRPTVDPTLKDWRERPNKQGWEPAAEEERTATFVDRHRRQREMGAHRRFDMPRHANEGRGWCRWCGEAVIERSGKRKGQRSANRTWHQRRYGDERDCLLEYQLHVDQEVQYWFLIERDGPGCADCGRGNGHWKAIGLSYDGKSTRIGWSVVLEVDHELPLYLKSLLDDLKERRAMHHPVNLKLRCEPCHRAKSAREAKDRAARRA